MPVVRMPSARRRVLLITGGVAGVVAAALLITSVELITALARLDDDEPWCDSYDDTP
jgi:hypothetical protein